MLRAYHKGTEAAASWSSIPLLGIEGRLHDWHSAQTRHAALAAAIARACSSSTPASEYRAQYC